MPKRLLPLVPDALSILRVQPKPEGLVVFTTPRPAPVVCPTCQRPSHRRHGFSERTLVDLPWQGCAVQLRVRVRRLCCPNPACERRTFSEPLPPVAAADARRSRRLGEVQRHLGLALGGEAGRAWRNRRNLSGNSVRHTPPARSVGA